MAAVQNLEIIVDVDISEAVAKLADLQEELQDLAESISRVDAQGSEGIDIRTDIDNVEDDLSKLKAKIEAFEQSNELDIDSDIDSNGGLAEAMGWLDMPVEEAAGRAGMDISDLGVNEAEFSDIGETLGEALGNAIGTSTEVGEAFRGGDGGDEGIDLSEGIRRAKRQLNDMTDSLSVFQFNMADMHNIMARLIPLLLVFVGAIPAAYTALIGLATAAFAAAASLAAIAGLGALGVGLVGGQFDMQRITDMFEEVRSAFIEAFAPLAERLQPIFEGAIDGLERFFQSIANQGQALMALADEAQAFGGFIMDFVPGALRVLAGLVESMAGIFGDIGRSISNNFSSIIRTLVELTAEAVPVVAEMAQIIGSALPSIIRMSIGFAQVANNVMQFIGFLFRLIGLLGITPEQFGLVTGAILAFASAAALATTNLVKFAATGMANATLALFNFLRGLIMTNNAMGYLAVTNLGRAIASMYGFIQSLLAGGGALGIFSGATISATGALAAFLTLATLGAAAAVLVPMAMSAASAFMGLSGGIDQATSSLKDFDRVSGRVDGVGSMNNPYGGSTGPSGTATGGSGSNVTVNVESSGDQDDDASNVRNAAWRVSRRTGGNN